MFIGLVTVHGMCLPCTLIVLLTFDVRMIVLLILTLYNVIVFLMTLSYNLYKQQDISILSDFGRSGGLIVLFKCVVLTLIGEPM